MAQQLPAGLKALLVRIFNATNKIEEELKLQGNMHAELIKKMVNKLLLQGIMTSFSSFF
jgi:(-)-germacrene D synthase